MTEMHQQIDQISCPLGSVVEVTVTFYLQNVKSDTTNVVFCQPDLCNNNNCLSKLLQLFVKVGPMQKDNCLSKLDYTEGQQLLGLSAMFASQTMTTVGRLMIVSLTYHCH